MIKRIQIRRQVDFFFRIDSKVAPSKTDSVSVTRDFAGLEEDPQAAISQTPIVAAFDRLNIGVFEPELESTASGETDCVVDRFAIPVFAAVGLSQYAGGLLTG